MAETSRSICVLSLAYTLTLCVSRCPRKSAISTKDMPLCKSRVAHVWRKHCGPECLEGIPSFRIRLRTTSEIECDRSGRKGALREMKTFGNEQRGRAFST